MFIMGCTHCVSVLSNGTVKLFKPVIWMRHLMCRPVSQVYLNILLLLSHGDPTEAAGVPFTVLLHSLRNYQLCVSTGEQFWTHCGQFSRVILIYSRGEEVFIISDGYYGMHRHTVSVQYSSRSLSIVCVCVHICLLWYKKQDETIKIISSVNSET